MFVVGCETVKVYTSAMVLSRVVNSHLLDTREFPLEQQEKKKFHGKNHDGRTQRGQKCRNRHTFLLLAPSSSLLQCRSQIIRHGHETLKHKKQRFEMWDICKPLSNAMQCYAKKKKKNSPKKRRVEKLKNIRQDRVDNTSSLGVRPDQPEHLPVLNQCCQ